MNVYKAPGLKNKLLYIVMPPGWSHTGDHKTAKAVKRKLKEEKLKVHTIEIEDAAPANTL